MVLAIAVLAIVLAGNPDSKVLGLVAYAWAGFGAAFGPLIILSLFWKRMTLEGALAGMIVGAVVVIGWKTFRKHWCLRNYSRLYLCIYQHHRSKLDQQSAKL